MQLVACMCMYSEHTVYGRIWHHGYTPTEPRCGADQKMTGDLWWFDVHQWIVWSFRFKLVLLRSFEKRSWANWGMIFGVSRCNVQHRAGWHLILCRWMWRHLLGSWWMEVLPFGWHGSSHWVVTSGTQATFALTMSAMSEKSWTHNLTKSRDDLDNPDVCWILLIIFQGCPWHGTDGPDEYPAGCWGQWHHTALGTSKRRLATTFQVQDPMAVVSNQILVEQWPQWPMGPLLMCLDCTKLTTFFPGIGYLLLTRLYIISWPMASSLCFLPWPHYPKTLAGVPKLRQTHAQWPLKKNKTYIPSPRAKFMNNGVNHG